jgi:hypothetical protein
MQELKKKWNTLLSYGVGIAAIFVITVAAVCMMIVVGVAVITAKVLVFIK